MERKLGKVDQAIFDLLAHKIHAAIGNCCSEEDLKKVEDSIERLIEFADAHSV